MNYFFKHQFYFENIARSSIDLTHLPDSLLNSNSLHVAHSVHTKTGFLFSTSESDFDWNRDKVSSINEIPGVFSLSNL